MAGVNKVIIMGHLGRDPEMRYMQDGKAIANLSIATSEKYKDKNGEVQEKTEWHRIVLFGRSAEVAGEYLHKGSMAYIEGRLQTRKWTDKDGQERYTTEILGDRLQLVGGRSDNGQGQSDGSSERPAQNAYRPAASSNNRPASTSSREEPDDFDDIPF